METMPFEFSEVILDNFDSFLDESFSEFQNGTDTATQTASGGGQSVDYGAMAQSTVSTVGNIVSIVQSSKAKKEAKRNPVQRTPAPSRSNSKKRKKAEEKKQLAMKFAQEKAKEKQRNMYILIGVGVLLVAGYFYYQKNKQA